MTTPLTIALVAHDNKKNDMVCLATEFKELLTHPNIHLIGTGTTGINNHYYNHFNY